MSDSRGGSNEPSMEEILASIRRIIAEDSEQVERNARQGSSASAAAESSADPTAETAFASEAEHWPEDREAARPQTLHPVPSPEPEDGDDVLELTQLVNEDGSVTDLSEGGGPAMPYVAEEETQEESLQRDPEIREEPQEREAQVIEEHSSIVQTHHEQSPGEKVVETEAVEDAEVEQDGPKVMTTEAGSAAGSAEMRAQVDSEVRAWLDRNLPEMVERVVREEVERMLRRLKD